MRKGIRDRLAHAWADIVVDHPAAIIILSLLLAGGSIWLTVEKLTFLSDRTELIDRDLPWNQKFTEYEKQFPGDADLIVIVVPPEGEDGRERAHGLVRNLAKRLEAMPEHVLLVAWAFDANEASAAAVRLLPKEDFDARLAEIEGARALLEARDMAGLIGTAAAGLQGSSGGVEKDAAKNILRLARLLGVAMTAFEGGDVTKAFAPLIEADGAGLQYFETEDPKLVFMRVRPRLEKAGLDAAGKAVAAVAEALAAARVDHPGVDAGLTGVPALETDETRVTMRDSTWCSIISLIAIVLLLMAAHEGWRMTVTAMAALLIGVAWSFGFLTLAIGHLQVLSAAFTSILFGLGIDYAIYLGTRYEEARAAHPAGIEGFRAALRQTLVQTGPGVVTGALTPALAFATTLLTDFRGMAEMGLIAAAGVLLCLLATLTVFLAFLRLALSEPRHVTHPDETGFRIFDGRWVTPFWKRPKTTLCIATIVTLAAAPTIARLRYDYNLLNLQAEGLDSVAWQERIPTRITWSAATLVGSLDEARSLTARFRSLPTVADVGGVGVLFPADEDRKLEALEAVASRMKDVLSRTEAPPSGRAPFALALRIEATGLSLAVTAALAGAAKDAAADVKAALAEVKERCEALSARLGGLDTAQAREGAEALQAGLHAAQEILRSRLLQALATRPLVPEDLPSGVREEFVGQDGRFALKILPAVDIWQPEGMERFLGELRSVDPHVTGPPVSLYESAQLIKNSYAWAGVYAFIIVFITLLIDFRRLSDALLALLPVFIGFAITFAVMLLAKEPLNPANIIILPILFGIGVESGVHMLHRQRQHPDADPPGLALGTGKGVVLATLTTIIGFASMLFAHHRGIRSLGFVVSVGMSAILAACLIVMPAILALRRGRRGKTPNIRRAIP